MESPRKEPKISGSTSISGIDRISYLPDDVLHYILSSLSIFDAAELGLLSKRWKYIWATLPYFRFDLNSVYIVRRKWPSIVPTSERFKDFINWVLISQSAVKLVRFILCCSNRFDKVAISRWIHATTMRSVQELVLEFSLGEPFELPYSLATCESLHVLKLHLSGGILKLPNHFGLCRLKLLHLEQIELSNKLISCLFSKCHLLETLILEDCSLGTMTLLDIASTSLVYVTLRNVLYNAETYANCVVKVTCPNLKFLKYKAPTPKDVIIENLISIEVFYISLIDMNTSSEEEIGILVHKMIKEVPSTSVLKLCMTSISGLYEATRKGRLCPVSFNKLKFLRLNLGVDDDFVQVMILLLKSSPNLEVLKLWSDENYGWSENWQLHDPDESIVCLKSHLKSVQLTGFKDEENEIELIRFFLKNAQVLEKLTIRWDCSVDNPKKASNEVLKLPRTSHVCLTFLEAKPWPPRPRSWYDNYKK